MVGRLIRKKSYRRKRKKTTGYIVAVADAAEAIDLIRKGVAEPGDEIEDLGPVSDGLLQALNVPAGGFVYLDRGRTSVQASAAPYDGDGRIAPMVAIPEPAQCAQVPHQRCDGGDRSSAPTGSRPSS